MQQKQQELAHMGGDQKPEKGRFHCLSPFFLCTLSLGTWSLGCTAHPQNRSPPSVTLSHQRHASLGISQSNQTDTWAIPQHQLIHLVTEITCREAPVCRNQKILASRGLSPEAEVLRLDTSLSQQTGFLLVTDTEQRHPAVRCWAFVVRRQILLVIVS